MSSKKINQKGGSVVKSIASPFGIGSKYATKAALSGTSQLKGVPEFLFAGPNTALEQAKDLVEDVTDDTPLGGLYNDLLEKKNPAELAAMMHNASNDGGKKAFVKPVRLSGEKEFWDLLYKEPCWIDPETNTFDLATAFGKLWFRWYVLESSLQNGAGDALDYTNASINTEKLKELYIKTISALPEGVTMEQMEKFNKAVNNWQGSSNEENPNGGNEPTNAIGNEQSNEYRANDDGLLEALSISKEAAREAGVFEFEHNAFGTLLSGGWMELLAPPAPKPAAEITADASPGTSVPRDWTKWWFCFVFKFALGPVGLLILKIMPYFMKFVWSVYDGARKLLFFIFSFRGRPYFYTSKSGQARKKTVYPYHTPVGYLGLIIPLGLLKYDWGQVYGNGSFGKFIVSLTLLSIGLILMSGISIFVFLIVFMMYCGKTLAMFGDNIESKNKK